MFFVDLFFTEVIMLLKLKNGYNKNTIFNENRNNEILKFFPYLFHYKIIEPFFV